MNERPKAESRSRSGANVEGGEAKSGNGERKQERLRLTDRDRQLMGMLATVRYLSTGQLQRLLFSERSSINLSKRLLALAGEGKHGLEVPYLKRLTYRSWDGVLQHAWTLTRAGYALAESVLLHPAEPPAKEAGVDFIEHGLMLNELYVQLLEAPVRAAFQQARARAQKAERPSRAMLRLKAAIYARAHHPGFRWWTHDASKLPWKEYDLKADKTRDRLILPDATLELLPRHDGAAPTSGRRWFLEAETGSHTLVAQSDEKRGATVAKLQQYDEFITGRAGDRDDATWYAKRHPDGLPPRVVFLVRTEARRQSVQKVIDAWTQETGSALKAKVYTVAGAAAEFGRLLGGSAPVAPARAPRTIVSAEVRLLKEFHASAVALATRLQPQGPTLPAGTVRVAKLLERLAAKSG